LNLLFVFYWLITYWKKSWLSIACLILGANYIALSLSFSPEKKVEEYDLSIASYNMNYGLAAYNRKTKKFNQEQNTAFGRFLKMELNPDILCAQEFNKRTKEFVGKHYPFTHQYKNTGTAILSRYPIINKGKIDFGTITNSCVWADIAVNEDTIRVYSLHLQSNNISRDADQMVEDAESHQKLDLVPIKAILGKYKRYVGIRAEQTQILLGHASNSPYPVILAGDLNDPPVSYTHRLLTKNRQDAFSKKGSGLGVTYGGNVPLLRIDNIILDEAFEVLSFRTIKKPFSDHYPVISQVNIE
jgi:endonuclease/exonuclease/phosphatase family metal-dependent hydrolase